MIPDTRRRFCTTQRPMGARFPSPVFAAGDAHFFEYLSAT
jgi:hypothetical protein